MKAIVTTTTEQEKIEAMNAGFGQKELATLVRRLEDARVEAKAIRENLNPKYEALLAGFVDEKGNPVTKWEHSYLIVASAEKMADMYHRANQIALAEYPDTPAGKCPALMAESRLHTLEEELVNACAPFTGMSFDRLMCMHSMVEAWVEALIFGIKDHPKYRP